MQNTVAVKLCGNRQWFAIGFRAFSLKEKTIINVSVTWQSPGWEECVNSTSHKDRNNQEKWEGKGKIRKKMGSLPLRTGRAGYGPDGVA